MIGQSAIADAAGVIDVPLPPDVIDAGAAHLTLIYSGGATPNRCFDRRVGADNLHFSAQGGLSYQLAPGQPLSSGAAAALIGSRPTILMPATISPEQAAAALTVAAAHGGAHVTTSTPGADGSYVRIADVAAPALRSEQAGGVISLAVGGRDPATAARLAFSRAAPLLATPAVDHAVATERTPDTLTFADLGADLSPTMIAEEGGWTTTVSASRLPTGQEIAGLTVAVAALPIDAADSVSVWLNDTMLGAARLSPSGQTRLEVSAPPGTAHSLNAIAVKITRARRDDCGDTPRGWPAQLLGSSSIHLRPVQEISDFHDFANAAHAGVSVVMPNPTALPIATAAVAGLIDGSVPIKVSWEKIPDEGPVILISDTPPPGATPKVAADGGRLKMTTAVAGEADLDLPDDKAVTIAQLVDAGGRPILWIRPARSVTPASMWLDQGDVAFVAADGAVTPLSTVRPRLASATLPSIDEAPWWQTNAKLLLILAGILAGACIVAWSFRPSVKKPKPGQDV